MKQIAEEKIVNFFAGKDIFSRRDLFDFFVQSEDYLKEGTLGWRIYELKKKSILHEVKRGWYTLNVKPTYMPGIDHKVKRLASIFNKNYRDSNTVYGT